MGTFSTVMSNKEQADNGDDCLWGLCNRDESRPAASAFTDGVAAAVGAVGYGTRFAAGASAFTDGVTAAAGAIGYHTVNLHPLAAVCVCCF